ncbi:MAG: hypothetical protein HQL76_16360 [Magnetococcales bacterium]|nr:hypothetical protein [Magnetococcales bacterium]
MPLSSYLEHLGHIFFRFRSFTPLLLVPLVVFERHHINYPFGSHSVDLLFEALCLLVALMGHGIRVGTVGHVPHGTSGRNTREQKAEILNTTGLYSIVRNPLYLGNYLILMGISLLLQNWEVLLFNTLLFALAYTPIILTEEAFLLERFGVRYREYADRVPCMIPRPSLWRTPELPFSFAMALYREHDTVFTTIIVFIIIENLRSFVVHGRLGIESVWIPLSVFVLTVWIFLKVLKKTGRLTGR